MSGVFGSSGTSSENAGQILQTVIHSSSSLASGTTLAFYDENTVPLSTDGNPVFGTLSITPKSSSSTLLISVEITASCAGENMGICVFDGVNAPAIGVIYDIAGPSTAQLFSLLFPYTPAATGELTFTVSGFTLGGTATIYFNADSSGNPIGGGANWSIVVIQELAA